MSDDDIKRIHLETTGFDLDRSESALLDFARAVEQASRRTALKEIAQLAEGMALYTGYDVAQSIRALAAKEQS